MLPDSQRGFAPTIRGVAHSNARVSVRQHGYTIYETYVALAHLSLAISSPLRKAAILRSRSMKVMEANARSPTLLLGGLHAAGETTEIQRQHRTV